MGKERKDFRERGNMLCCGEGREIFSVSVCLFNVQLYTS